MKSFEVFRAGRCLTVWTGPIGMLIAYPTEMTARRASFFLSALSIRAAHNPKVEIFDRGRIYNIRECLDRYYDLCKRAGLKVVPVRREDIPKQEE